MPNKRVWIKANLFSKELTEYEIEGWPDTERDLPPGDYKLIPIKTEPKEELPKFKYRISYTITNNLFDNSNFYFTEASSMKEAEENFRNNIKFLDIKRSDFY